MTLLSRGLKSTGQGLGYIDKAIAKEEQAKARAEQLVDRYSSDLSGMKSSGNYLGETSRTVAQEFANAYEQALDIYSNDPSRENKNRLDNIRQQSSDFINIALGARQNSINQYNAFNQDSAAYLESPDKALEMFNAVENTPGIRASFDMDTMEMYMGDQDGMNPLASFGYYNGTAPLHYSKKPTVTSVKAEGEWAADHYEQYSGLLNAEGGRDKVIEGFRETGRFDSSGLQDTAIFNYLLDVKRVSKDDPAFLEMLQDVRNNPEELNMALDHMANIEYQYMLGIHNYKQREAISAAMSTAFRGDISERRREQASGVPDLTNPEDQDTSDKINDGLFGAHFVRQLATPLNTTSGENGINGLKALGYDRLTGLEVDALGQIVVSVEKILTDEEGEEIGVSDPDEFILNGRDPDNNDLYNNLKARLMSQGLWSSLMAQSYNRQMSWEEKQEEDRYKRAIAAQERQEQQTEVNRILTDVTTTEEDVRRASTGLNERGRERQAQEQQAVEDVRARLAESGFMERSAGAIELNRGSGTVLGSPIETSLNNAFIDRLIDRGYNADQIEMGIDRMIQDYGRQKVSGLRVGAQSLVRGIFEGLGRVNDKDYTDFKEPLDLFEKSLAAASSDAANVEADQIREEAARRSEDRLSNVEGTYGTGVSKDYLYSILDDKSKRAYDNRGGVAVLTNNPGNLRPYQGYDGPVYYNRDNPNDAFRVFSSPEEGLEALKRDVEIKVSGAGVMESKLQNKSLPSGAQNPEDITILDMISVYAPVSENDPDAYSRAIAKFAKSKGYEGVTQDSLATALPIGVLVEAIIKVESGQNHRRLTSQGLFDTPSGQAGRA